MTELMDPNEHALFDRVEQLCEEIRAQRERLEDARRLTSVEDGR